MLPYAAWQSSAAPEMAGGAKGVWALLSGGHLHAVAEQPELIDALALVIASGTSQGL